MEGAALLTVIALAFGPQAVKAIRKPSVSMSLERPRPLPSSAPIGQDAHDVRSFDAWVLHPGHEVSPRGVVAAFAMAERGQPQIQCDLIDDIIEGDCTLRNLFEQREQAVAGKTWTLQGDGPDEASATAARVLSVALRRLNMIPVWQHLLTDNRYGYSAAEMDWGVAEIDGRTWIVPTWVQPVEARRFRISPTDELRLFTTAQRPEGDELRPGKWIVLKRPGRLARAGLMRSAVWPAIGKRLGWRDWMVFSQRFGLPLPLVSYDEGSDSEAIDVAETILKKIGSDGGAVIPKGIKVDMVDATKGTVANDKTHGGLIAHCNAEMAKLIVGATLTNDNAGSGGASYALGEVHAAVRWDNVLFDAERLQEAVRTQIAAPFMRFNNLTGAAPLLKLQVVRDIAPGTLVDMAVKLKNQLGVEISISQLRQLSGYYEPVGASDQAPGLQVENFPAASGGIPS